MNKISDLIKMKNRFLHENDIKSELSYQGKKRNFYQILQSETIGTNMTPQLSFSIKSWNKELTGFYRPDIEDKMSEEKISEEKI